MPLTKLMRVRQAFPDDIPVMRAIADMNGLKDYEVPWGDTWGCLATFADTTVAFCVGRDVREGILIEDLWSIPNNDGLRGLHALAEWIEEAGKLAAQKVGKPIKIGGAVMNSNMRHEAALESRGYAPYAKILCKEIQP